MVSCPRTPVFNKVEPQFVCFRVYCLVGKSADIAGIRRRRCETVYQRIGQSQPAYGILGAPYILFSAGGGTAAARARKSVIPCERHPDSNDFVKISGLIFYDNLAKRRKSVYDIKAVSVSSVFKQTHSGHTKLLARYAFFELRLQKSNSTAFFYPGSLSQCGSIKKILSCLSLSWKALPKTVFYYILTHSEAFGNNTFIFQKYNCRYLFRFLSRRK